MRRMAVGFILTFFLGAQDPPLPLMAPNPFQQAKGDPQRDARKLLFVSGRDAKNPRQFNVFSADWVK